MQSPSSFPIRHDWTRTEVSNLMALPFNDLMFQAQLCHRQNFDPNQVQVSILCSIKTGACPEDCAYCPQSIRYDTGLEKEKLMQVEKVVAEAKSAKAKGATRFCMGAAWRSPKKRDMQQVTEMVRQVKELGLETCMTLGMLSGEQAEELAASGLDYYNHNLDTSPEYYGEIITTRKYADRLSTLDNVRGAGLKVCSGGILGMGEQQDDRIGLLLQLATLPKHPESVPINMLIRIKGTPLENVDDIDPIEFVRTIALARILMPESYVRLSAGREQMSDEMQAMAFMAGANSIFLGDKLLTAANPDEGSDAQLFERLGINAESRELDSDDALEQGIGLAVGSANKNFYDATQTVTKSVKAYAQMA
ncbi:MAG: biotin synthase BioB [SAR86 cluster bacterium]|uniref:Biotin synthase n=1 Tax=SAR86 cluster bacterium TaxID=2030880 RepID=A0A2A4MIU1_9GAMM|nr:MAG: biotin synthase BioB [SAR86 cluster bacterium]